MLTNLNVILGCKYNKHFLDINWSKKSGLERDLHSMQRSSARSKSEHRYDRFDMSSPMVVLCNVLVEMPLVVLVTETRRGMKDGMIFDAVSRPTQDHASEY